jgi:hypothetical protein
MTIGRNDPCACGSGTKYKKCCGSATLSEAQPYSPGKFRFEPGSYGGPDGAFVPSILCQKRMSETEWRDHFLLVNPTDPHYDHDSAVAAAETDLAEAFAAKQDCGRDADVAISLKSKGYVNVSGFKIIKEEGNAEQRSAGDADKPCA